MDPSNSGFNPGIIQIQTQWQRIHEEAYGIANPLASLHATGQHRTEHYLFHPAATGQHLPPGQMAQSRQAHTQPPYLNPQTVIQSLGHRAAQLDILDAILVDVA
jgi:hypothetical protein